MKKTCTKCEEEKDVLDFYAHPKTADKLDTKCKACVKAAQKQNYHKKMCNPDFVESEKARNRVRMKGVKREVSPEKRQEIQQRHNEKYPEKRAARDVCQHVVISAGLQKHHWSYRQEHYKDVIALSSEDHALLHRHIVYDQERHQYRRADNNQLLDSRVLHEDFALQIGCILV